MEKPTVLFAASTSSHIRSFHLPYLQEFKRLGWEVHVTCGGPEKEISGADRVIFLPFDKKMHSPRNYSATKQLRKEIKANSYTLIITHTSLAAFFTRLAVKNLKHRPPLVNMVHGYLFDDETSSLKKTILSFAERLTVPETDLLLTMNDWDFGFARKKKLSSRISNIPGIGVDFSRLNAAATEKDLVFCRMNGFAEDDVLLLYAAEFSNRKNQSLLIKAMPQLPPNIKLILPGEGDLLNACRVLARKLGVERRVMMPGFVNNMSQWYANADIAVSASRSEGLPFNVMEALHFGLPVIASDVKGHRDLIHNGINGFLYPFGDQHSLEMLISQLAGSPTWRSTLSANAPKSVEQYSLDWVLPQVMEKYLSAVKSRFDYQTLMS